MKKILKRTGKIFCLFLLIVVLVNILSPLFCRKPDETYVESLRKTEFTSETAGVERICCIDDNEEALLWRLRMIGTAKESIVLSTFDLRADDNGTKILAALNCAFHRISGLNRNTQRSKCILKLIIQVLPSFPDHTIFLPFQIKHRNRKHKKQHPFTFVKKIICHYAQRQCLSHIFQKFFHRKTIMIIITFLIKLFFFFPFHSSIPALSSFST